MIRTARLRASGFQGRRFCKKKSDQPMRRLRSKVDAHYSTYYPGSVIDRSFAGVAVQHWLGLLPKRRARIDFSDLDNPRRNRATLI
jgi:hypothetical protein